MSKDCRECEYFGGYDDEDGTPYCDCDGGYELCPFNNSSGSKNNGFKIEIDTKFLSDYIRHTIQNTVDNSTQAIIVSEIKKIVSEAFEETIRSKTKETMDTIINQQVAEFMSGTIEIGGGWMGPSRTLTRQDYMAEIIEERLGKTFNDGVKNVAAAEITKQIDKFTRQTRDQINAGVKQYFNEATRQILTENVVTMLMQNDTYQRLSASMNHFLPEGK